MLTVVISIGNSDDKLTQKQWSEFVMTVEKLLRRTRSQIHFSGGPSNSAPWQNWCWVVNLDGGNLEMLRLHLKDICSKYKQESIALTVGMTELIQA